jgi:hypothetical protein
MPQPAGAPHPGEETPPLVGPQQQHRNIVTRLTHAFAEIFVMAVGRRQTGDLQGKTILERVDNFLPFLEFGTVAYSGNDIAEHFHGDGRWQPEDGSSG